MLIYRWNVSRSSCWNCAVVVENNLFCRIWFSDYFTACCCFLASRSRMGSETAMSTCLGLEEESHHDHYLTSGGFKTSLSWSVFWKMKDITIMIRHLEDVTYPPRSWSVVWKMSHTHVMIMMMTSGGCHLHMSSRDFSALKPSSLSANAEEAKQLATSPARLDSGES